MADVQSRRVDAGCAAAALDSRRAVRAAGTTCVALLVAASTGSAVAADLACPEGSFRRTKAAAPSSPGDEAWCEDRRGTRQGPYRRATSYAGKVEHVVEGTYLHGKKTGTWREWHDGQPSTVTAYRDGRKHGLEITRYLGGALHERSLFSAGKRNGIQETFDGAGHLSTRVRMVDDREEGRYTDWDSAGKVCSQGNYRHGKKIGRWLVCRELAGPQARGRYEGDRRTGAWTFFTVDGQRTAVGHYRGSKRDGAWTFIADDGKATASRGTYRAGRRHGHWRVFGPDDVVTDVNCRNGEAHGRAVRRLGPSFGRPRVVAVEEYDAEPLCAGTADRLRAFDDYGYDVEDQADDSDGPG